MTCVDASRPWAIVPVKSLMQAKSRLAQTLSVEKRVSLASVMLQDVLRTLSQTTATGGTLVVTGDGDVARCARAFGSTILDEPAQGGLNEAVSAGLNFLSSRNIPSAFVVPADLPLIDQSDVARIVGGLTTNGAVIAEAKRDGGTNILAMELSRMIAPQFGIRSFQRHLDSFRHQGIEPMILESASLNLDIDSLHDLTSLMDIPGRTGTQLHLENAGFGHRAIHQTSHFPLEARP